MPLLDVTVHYLEMLAPPAAGVVPPSPLDGLAVRHVPAPSVEFYRALYNAVGKDYDWYSRRIMTDDALAAIIHDPLDEMHLLELNGEPVGFAELDRRRPAEIELVQFGLTTPLVGRGLGKWFLEWTIDRAWSYAPKRFWLHTCSRDHPAALPNYLKRGFVKYKEEQIRRPP
jgi:GNAT superfamily N-acetyltransferase